MKILKKVTSVLLMMAMVLSLIPQTAAPVFAAERYVDGVYQGTGTGRNGDITLSVTIQDEKITEIEEVSQNETPAYWEMAKALFETIKEAGTPEVDGVSGATKSSNGIKDAVRNALSNASAEMEGSTGQRKLDGSVRHHAGRLYDQ